MSAPAVGYYRVSTQRQGTSGLGLEAQQAAVREYCARAGLELVSERVEVESGRETDRPELCAAILESRRRKARLVIAKLDRLARNTRFLLQLRDTGVDFVACDMPDANRLTITILAAVAEDEADRISARTKAALAARKARGLPLGNPRASIARVAYMGGQVLARRADEAAEKVRGQLTMVLREAKTDAEAAELLNARGVPSPTGAPAWTNLTVWRTKHRLAVLDRRGAR